MMLDAALELARAGWRVFPVWHVRPDGACACGNATRGQIGKHPRCLHGHTDATTDEAKVRRWWASGPVNRLAPDAWERCPDSNIGIAVPEGIVIVDVDPRNGGEATFEAICAAHGAAWTETQYVLSGGGGLQLYLSCEPGRRFPANLDAHFGKGIDLKQAGGYVLAPPSNHKSGGTYAWGNPGTPILRAPAWLAALTKERAEAQLAPPLDVSGDTALDDALRARLDKAIDVIEPYYELGCRHALAFAIGGFVRNLGLPASAAYYLVGQLPSTDPTARVRDALRAFRLKDRRPLGADGIRDVAPELLAKLKALGFSGPSFLQMKRQRATEAHNQWVNELIKKRMCANEYR